MLPDHLPFLKNVSRETVEKLTHYHAELIKWQRSINLISPNTLDSVWERHIADSLQLLPLIASSAKTLFDFGSGAGFPGLALAIARPDISVHLVESDQKKCSFLSHVSRETCCSVSIHPVRIESFDPSVLPDIITARALASLPALCGYACPWFERNPDLVFLCMKGQKVEDEIEEAKRRYQFEIERIPSMTDKSASILQISALKKHI